MHRPDTLVLDQPTEVLGHPIAGRHRAPASPARRALTRIGLGAVGLLVVVAIGWWAADAVGPASTAGADLPAWSALPTEDEPNPARAARLPARQVPVAAPDAVDAGLSGGSTAQVPAELPAESLTARGPQAMLERSSSMKVGDTCSAPGAVGVTPKGKQVVCTARGGTTRWKHA